MRDSATDEVIAAAASLAPLITAASEEGEVMRCTPPRVVEAFAAAGLLQMFLLSKADGSVGWCT